MSHDVTLQRFIVTLRIMDNDRVHDEEPEMSDKLQHDDNPKSKDKTWVEEIEVAGNELVARVQELIEEGNVRRLIIRKQDGDLLIEVPLTAGVAVGGALAVFTPVLAAIGALAALVAQVRVEIVRTGEPEDEPKSGKTRIEIEEDDQQ